MTREHISPLQPLSPSDDRLIDYLLGEPADQCEAGHGFSDAAVEQWLAADEANAERLESLAVSVLASALPSPRPAIASPAAEAPSATGQRAAIIGLLATAAAITLAVFWTRDAAGPEELSTQRLAVAWMETVSVAVPESDLEDEWTGEWESSESEPWLLSDTGESFSGDRDSPPQWLLVAVDQMSLTAELEAAEPEGLP